ncbi:MAG: glycoside hydrolase family 43 protein [Agathobacter sp.]|nr:glycoside hydrolase family 43 protein [Agathobacter sp.]
MSNHVIKNPIIPGFYPDPSICRVGDDFYMVCSSFEMYPGLPVFHSKDLANWEQICYAMTKENGFYVNANMYAGGVMAPTIRYHEGVYYIMNCNFADAGNFIVTATDPAGPWSEPYWLDDIPGIDASIFFDEDGTCYAMGTGNVVKRADGTMDRGIWVGEFDIKTMKMAGEAVAIWDCALRVATSPEAPHIYKIGEYYYLVIAEGGTEHYHCVAVARSKDIKGWYEGNPANPVMTHRHFGFDYPIGNVGHADLVQTPQGNWYAVMLGSRTIEGIHKNLGRETYICPVMWERDWPIFSPRTGKIEWEYPADEFLPWTEYEKEADRDNFDSDKLSLSWSFWGTPFQDFWKIADGKLSLQCLKRPIVDRLRQITAITEKEYDNCVSFMCKRQIHVDFEVATQMSFLPQNQESAGLVIMQASNHQYRLERVVQEGQQLLQLVLVTTELHGMPYLPNFSYETTTQVLDSIPYEGSDVVLKMVAKGQDYTFYYGATEDTLTAFPTKGDGKLINPEIVGGMVGTILGVYASGNGVDSTNCATFDWFEYKGVE